MKFILAASVTIFFLFGAPAFGQAQVSVDHVDGLIGINTLGTGHDIRFYIRYSNQTGYTVTGATNGFRVYSPDGAQWTPLTYAATGAITAEMFEQLFFNPFSADGALADTIGFGGFKLVATGIPSGFDAVVMYLETKVHSAFDGKTLCLDTAFYRPAGYWLWSMADIADIHPEWDGPHCYTIEYDVTDVADGRSDALPDDFELFQNYPNPFNPTTEIRFTLPERSRYKLTIFNALGREVSAFAGEHGPGEVSLQWDGADNAAGVYFYRLQAGDYTAVRKMVLVK
jgi:hypothetical protein